MEQVTLLLAMSAAVFLGTLAYAAFYGFSLLAGGCLLLLLVGFKRRARPTGAVVGWLTVACVAGILGEALWYRAHPGGQQVRPIGPI